MRVLEPKWLLHWEQGDRELGAGVMPEITLAIDDSICVFKFWKRRMTALTNEIDLVLNTWQLLFCIGSIFSWTHCSLYFVLGRSSSEHMAASILNWVDLLLNALQSLFCIESIFFWTHGSFYFGLGRSSSEHIAVSILLGRVRWKHTKPKWAITFMIWWCDDDPSSILDDVHFFP